MKILRFVSLCSAFLFSSHALSAPASINAPVQKIYVPNGFDSNDNVQVVMSGTFPNSCYKTGSTGSSVDLQSNTVLVWAKAFDYSGAGHICTQALVPFIQEVNVGILPSGKYKVKFASDPSISNTLTVDPHRIESPDDHLYAPVQSAMVLDAEIKADDSDNYLRKTLTLSGKFPYLFVGCLIMKEVIVRNTPNDVLVAMPVAEEIDDARCGQEGTHNFKVDVPINEVLTGDVLLHVRVMNGHSLNQVLSFPE